MSKEIECILLVLLAVLLVPLCPWLLFLLFYLKIIHLRPTIHGFQIAVMSRHPLSNYVNAVICVQHRRPRKRRSLCGHPLCQRNGVFTAHSSDTAYRQ